MPAATYVPSRVGEGYFTDFQAPAAGSTDNNKAWLWNSATGRFAPGVVVLGAAGSSGQVQFNSAGAFAGDAGFVYVGGRVGVGTTAPARAFEVGTSTGDQYIRINAPANNYALLEFTQQGGNVNDFVILRETGGKVYMQQNAGSVNTLVFGATGNVGIGTTSPNNKLHVNIGTDLNWRFGYPSNNVASIAAINDASSAYIDSRIDGLVLALNSQSGGNVGIGIASPSSKLEVSGDVRLTNSSSAIRGQNVTQLIKEQHFGYDPSSYHAVQVGGGYAVSFGVDVSDVTGGNFRGTDEIIVPNNFYITQVNSGSTNFKTGVMVLNDGNIGFGTYTPNGRLDVNGVLRLSGVGTSILTTTDASGLYLDANTGGGMYIQSDAAIYIRGSAGTSYVERMRIDGSGNVGIGTGSSPQTRLDVKAPGTNASSLEFLADFYKSSAKGAGIGLRAHDTEANISSWWGTAGTGVDLTMSAINSSGNYTEGIRVQQSTGNVGINITSPTSLLDLAASTTSRSHLRLRPGVAPSAPNNGDVWFDGTDFKCHVGGVTKTFTVA